MDPRLDEIRSELASIQDRLLITDDLEARAELTARQAQLREEAHALAGEVVSSDQLRRQIALVESRIKSHLANRLDKHAAAQTGMGGGIDPGVVHVMNQRMDEAAGLQDLKTELASLKARLGRVEAQDG